MSKNYFDYDLMAFEQSRAWAFESSRAYFLVYEPFGDGIFV